MTLSDETLNKLMTKSGLSKEELFKRINEKANEFSGLITKEGAAYIVSKEFGIGMEKPNNFVKLKDLTAASKKINTTGRIIKTTPVKEFVKSNGNKGRVANIYLSDGTGYAKLPLWDDQVNLVQDGLIAVNSIIQVSTAIAKENPFGELEISLGKFGTISLADDILTFPSSEELLERYFPLSPRRTSIKELTPGNAEISGVVVQVFKSKFSFSDSESQNYLVISCVIDDGTGDIRVVFFRDLAEEVSGINPDTLDGIYLEARYNLVTKNLLGKEFIVMGRVVKNTNFDRLEMVASEVKSLNVLEESKRLVDSIEATIGA